MNNTETKTLKFSIESTATPVEKDGKTGVEMKTEIHADVKNACTEQIAGLLAYLGEECIKKTTDEFKDRDEKPQIQEVAEEFGAKREEMLKNLSTALAKAMLKEMIEDVMGAMKGKEPGEPAKAESESEEEQGYVGAMLRLVMGETEPSHEVGTQQSEEGYPYRQEHLSV